MKKFQKTLPQILLICFLLVSPAFSQQLIKVYVNGVRMAGHPYMQDGIAYYPANPLSAALGVSISWNAQQRIVKIDDRVVVTTPLMKDGFLFLPVESVAGAAGAAVEWDGAGGIIRITGGKGAKTVETPIAPVVPTPVPTKTPDPVSPDSGYIPKPPVAYTGQPTKSAYPDADLDRKVSFQPKDAPPRLPSNLTPPPLTTQGVVGSPQNTYSTASRYTPRSESNEIFRVTVTNTEYVKSIKDYYKAKPGYSFIIVYLSQQNICDQVQVYTGRFSLLDGNNNSYDYIEGLSNFWLVILRPGGVNFGYLVFEVPDSSMPSKLALHGLNKAPLTVQIR